MTTKHRYAVVTGALAVGMAVTGTGLLSPASAATKPRTVKVVDAYVTTNAGDPSVLEVGDGFDIVLDKPIMAYAPDFAVLATDADGDAVYLSDNGSEIGFSVEDLVVTRKGRTRTYPDRVLAVTIRDAYEGLPQLDLPLTITALSGVYNAGNYDESARVDLARSKDTVIDLEP